MKPSSGLTNNTPQITLLQRRAALRPGGIETHAHLLAAGLSGCFTVESIAWSGPLWASILYTPGYYLRAARSRSRLIHCEDAVAALIGHLIQAGTGKALVSTLHGMDLIFPQPLYQRMLTTALKAHSAVVCVSRATARAAIERGCDPRRVEIIPNAAEKVRHWVAPDEARQMIERQTGISLRGKNVLFSLGRPMRRKGFDDFIESVFPHLPKDTIYIVAGPPLPRPFWSKSLAGLMGNSVADLTLIALGLDSVHERLQHLSNRPGVYYLNNASDALRNLLFFASDLFVMPNRRIPGDMEGFGIVGLEAAVRGIPVVATGIEGIVDAIHEGKNGVLAPEGNPAAMARIIRDLLENKDRRAALGRGAKTYTAKHFAQERITERYVSLFNRILSGRQEFDTSFEACLDE